MILRNDNDFLKHIIMMTGLKMKNRLIQQNMMKNILVYHECHH